MIPRIRQSAEPPRRSPLANLPGWDIAERIVAEQELRDAFKLLPSARRFALPRDPDKPSTDPDAEQLAQDVVREMRVG